MAEATIRDVARRADVSVASVSRALNGLANVHPDTRERVLAAAKELGYVPHAGARSLSMARTQAIGVVLPDLHGEFFSEVVRGLDREASARGYQLLLSNMHADAERAGQALRAMRGRVDGLVVMAPQLAPDDLATILPASIPAVLMNSAGAADRAVLRIDNAAGVAAMLDHLAAAGRRTIAHIAGPDGNIDAQERREAFARVAAATPGLTGVVVPGDFAEETGAAAARAMLDWPVPPDAIFAANDMMALGALQALREAGVDVPGRIAVAGFDDVPLARFLALTTMRVRLDEMGARAATRLIDQLEGRTDGAAAIDPIVPELIARATTGPARNPA